MSPGPPGSSAGRRHCLLAWLGPGWGRDVSREAGPQSRWEAGWGCCVPTATPAPCPLGLAAWEGYPTLKMLMEMVMTKCVGSPAAEMGRRGVAWPAPGEGAWAGLLAVLESQHSRPPGCLPFLVNLFSGLPPVPRLQGRGRGLRMQGPPGRRLHQAGGARRWERAVVSGRRVRPPDRRWVGGGRSEGRPGPHLSAGTVATPPRPAPATTPTRRAP